MWRFYLFCVWTVSPLSYKYFVSSSVQAGVGSPAMAVPVWGGGPSVGAILVGQEIRNLEALLEVTNPFLYRRESSMNYRKHPKFSSRDEGKQNIPA